jgi:hypothetical protein
MKDQADGIKAGTMLWSGLPNLFWVRPQTDILSLLTTVVGRSRNGNMWLLRDAGPPNGRREECDSQPELSRRHVQTSLSSKPSPLICRH